MKMHDVATAKRRQMSPLQRVRLAETMYTRPAPRRRDLGWIAGVLFMGLLVCAYAALEIGCALIGGC